MAKGQRGNRRALGRGWLTIASRCPAIEEQSGLADAPRTDAQEPRSPISA